MGNLIGAAFSGFIVGLLARAFYLGNNSMGIFMTMLLGIGGSIIANLVVSSRSGHYGSGVSRPGMFASVVGAMVLIFIGRHLGWH
jgi:uncharacterized membrane protein YeaQ/YmgE (transglycosylase-associated protein family)